MWSSLGVVKDGAPKLIRVKAFVTLKLSGKPITMRKRNGLDG